MLLVAGERSRGRGSSAARADAPASAASGLRRPRASETAPAASFVADARPLGRRRRTSQVSVSQTDPRDAPSHRSTQPCIPPGSLNRVPASAGVKGGNITSVGLQVTLFDPIWHVSSRSGAATLRTAIHLLLTYLHTHLFNGPFTGTTQVSRYQKGKTNLDFTEARDSVTSAGWQVTLCDPIWHVSSRSGAATL